MSRVIEERRRRLGSGIVEMLSLIKDWEKADARMQHTTEDKAMLDAFEDLFLDGDSIWALCGFVMSPVSPVAIYPTH